MKKMDKKTAKRILTGALAGIMLFGTVACGETETPPDENFGATNPYELKVFNFGGGYGREWLDTAIRRYKQERAGKEFTINGVTYDGVTFDIDPAKKTLAGMTQTGVKYDIWFHESVYYYQLLNMGFLAPMTEVLTTPNPYESGKTLESKLTEEQIKYYKVDTDQDGVGDTYYGIPHYAAYFGINYNKYMFDENGWYFKDGYVDADLDDDENFVFCFTKEESKRSKGPDGKKGTYDDGLPTTYREFYALCDLISATNKPVAWAGKYRGSYMNWFLNSMAAANEGAEQMALNYSFNGTAKNLIDVDATTGEITELDDVKIDGPNNGYMLAKQKGKYDALSFLETIIDNNWYTDLSVDQNNEQTTAQADFILGTSDLSQRAPMLLDGVWWEMEAASNFNTIQQATGRNDKNRYAFMPFPAPTQEEADRRAAAGANNEKYYTLLETNNAMCFLGSSIDDAERWLAIDFIQFINTDYSLAEFTKITDTTKALNYTISDDAKKELSMYGRSLVTLQENADIVSSFSYEAFYLQNEASVNDYYYKYSAKYTPDEGAVSVPVDEFRAGISAAKFFNGLYNYDYARWKTLAGSNVK